MSHELDDQTREQIEALAQEAGQRAAARELLRCHREETAADTDAVNAIEAGERARVSERLTQQFTSMGELPTGLHSDLACVAAPPDVASMGGRVAPPVITVLSHVTTPPLRLVTEIHGLGAEEIARITARAFRELR